MGWIIWIIVVSVLYFLLFESSNSNQNKGKFMRKMSNGSYSPVSYEEEISIEEKRLGLFKRSLLILEPALSKENLFVEGTESLLRDIVGYNKCKNFDVLCRLCMNFQEYCINGSPLPGYGDSTRILGDIDFHKLEIEKIEIKLLGL